MDLKPRTKSQHVTESGKWAESLRSLISRDDFWYALKQEHRQLSFLLTLYPELQRLARNAPTGERFVKDLERLRSRRARKFGIPEAELVRFEDLFRWPQRPSISQLKAASYAGDQFGLLFPKNGMDIVPSRASAASLIKGFNALLTGPPGPKPRLWTREVQRLLQAGLKPAQIARHVSPNEYANADSLGKQAILADIHTVRKNLRRTQEKYLKG